MAAIQRLKNKVLEQGQLAQSLIDLAETGIYMVVNGKFVYVSRHFEKLSGFSSRELLGKNSLGLVYPGDRQEVRAKSIAMLKGKIHMPFEYRFINKNGTLSWVLGKIVPVEGGDYRAALGSFWDITGYKQIEEKMAEQRAFLRQVIDSIPSLIFVKDAEDRYVLVNKSLAAAYNSKPTQMEGKTDIELGARPEEYQKYRRDDRAVLNSGRKKVIPEESFTWPSGEVHYYQTVKLPLAGSDGKYNRILGVSTDITERKYLERKLSSMATHDALTGLANRTLLTDRFRIAASQADRDKEKIAFAVMDLDSFKLVNDNYGHDAGDRLLKIVARRLTGALRKSDTVVRLGGDEFVIQFPGIRDRKNVDKIAQKILDSIRKPFFIAGRRVRTSASLGIVTYPDDGSDLALLLKKADKLMYIAKKAGKDGYISSNS